EPSGVRGAMEPYVAEAIGNDVFIRSGPGTNFYQCGKLYAGDRVQVIGTQGGWSCIIPPVGCFSWVSMQYVSINLDNPTMGVITGDNVGVYAGSDFVLPMHSTSKQVVLNRGQEVKLLGEEKDDYYKIAPPQGAYLWVSTQFLQPTDRTATAKTADPNVAATAMKTGDKSSAAKDPNAPKTDLEIYYALAEQIKAIQAKPSSERDYTVIKAKLTELAAKKDSGRAARYAEYTLKNIERFELADKSARELELQKKELSKTVSKIEEARIANLAQIPDYSKFAVMGKLERSSVYESGPIKRYRLVDESGKTIAYVTPVGAKAIAESENLVGRKVGLVGKIEPHEASARAFIEYTEIVPLD
ncbi:MAG TPA: SH3 domain-containing protein, partial [Sedimentisphaerales bacterium]|nr:SH3 domain-containing protein [Sedimentisphaerales bacterium]